jgi:choline dehydrogenase-like flavoprotein
MSQLHDVIVIGTGAAGVSAAFPLVETGADVMLIDPGQGEPAALPTGEYLEERQMSDHQWRWLLGSPGTVARFDPRYSPKIRVPTMQPVFADLAKVLRIKDEDFFPVGSLATGGLTRAWGAGVSQFNDADLREFPLTRADLEPHYRNVAARIGICGPASDDISAHFGMDELTMPPVTLDSVGQYLETRYLRVRDTLSRDGFAMGRARLAVITRDQPAWQQDGRLACDERGFCLWGCPRRAIYTADLDLLRLQRYPNCTHQRGMLVDSIAHADGCWLTRGQQRATDARFELRSRRLILAAGVLSSTRLVLQLLGIRETAIAGLVPDNGDGHGATLVHATRRRSGGRGVRGTVSLDLPAWNQIPSATIEEVC